MTAPEIPARRQGPNSSRLGDIYGLIEDLRTDQADVCLLLAAHAALQSIDMRNSKFSGRNDRKDRVREARRAVQAACQLFPAPNWES